MFTTMHPLDAAELHGDGYQNESQRAHAVSSIGTPLVDEGGKAQRIADNLGVFVVLRHRTRYCRHTDGILGVEVKIAQTRPTLLDAYALAFSLDPDDMDEAYAVIAPRDCR